MQKDVLSELNAAIQAAQQEVGAPTDENIAEVAVRLRKATTEAQTSIERCTARTSEHRSMYSYVRLSIIDVQLVRLTSIDVH